MQIIFEEFFFGAHRYLALFSVLSGEGREVGRRGVRIAAKSKTKKKRENFLLNR